MVYSKKGQLEMGITLMVIIIFMVLLIASLILYFRFTYTQIEENKATVLDQKFNSLLSVIIGLPEFRCSKGGVESECLDASKLSAVNEVIAANVDYYGNVFGEAEGIWVEIPDETGNNDYYNSNLFIIYGEKDGKGAIYAVPVSVFYPDYNQYKIGVLKIRGQI